MPASVGTEAAINHEPNAMWIPKLRAISEPSGLATIAVSHSADDRLRLAIPEYIRKRPRRGYLGSPGLAPAASVSENVSGNRTPARAVLLGNAGAMMPSSRKMLYDRPSVER